MTSHPTRKCFNHLTKLPDTSPVASSSANTGVYHTVIDSATPVLLLQTNGSCVLQKEATTEANNLFLYLNNDLPMLA